MQSNAPISSALIVASVPRAVRFEIMITGVGRSRMIFERKSMPFMFGISTSSVTTSGSSALMASRASKRIGGLADDLDVRILRQDLADQMPHRPRIIDNENFGLAHLRFTCAPLASER